MSDWISSVGPKVFGGALIVAGICHCDKMHTHSAGQVTGLAAVCQILKCIIALITRSVGEDLSRAERRSMKNLHVVVDIITCLIAYYSCKGMSTSILGFDAPALILILPGAVAIVFDYLGLPPHLIFGGVPIIAGICHCDMMVAPYSASTATAWAAIFQLLKGIIALVSRGLEEYETRDCLRSLKFAQVAMDIVTYFIAYHCCQGMSTSVLGFETPAFIAMLPGAASIAFDYLGLPPHETLGGALIVAAICHCDMTDTKKAGTPTGLTAIFQLVKYICALISRAVGKPYEKEHEDCLNLLQITRVIMEIFSFVTAVYSCIGVSTSILGYQNRAYIVMLPGALTILYEYIG